MELSVKLYYKIITLYFGGQKGVLQNLNNSQYIVKIYYIYTIYCLDMLF